MMSPQLLPPNAVFADDFRIIRQLGAGGMGSVYLAEQLSTGKRRALKLMLPELVAQPALRKRFELEARIGARIESDHVVEVIASGIDRRTGLPWLAMEFLDGTNLATYVAQNGPLTHAKAVEVFEQLSHALARAHAQHIVHRDLKPENIFLATPRRHGAPFVVKILDFGIARLAAEVKTTSSKTQGPLGTPLWMAPEQAESVSTISEATDVWALGLIVFWALTGRYFWKAANDPSASVMMLAMEAFAHPLPPATARAAEYACAAYLPLNFDSWFARCVVRSPSARYPDASEALSALRSLLAPQSHHAALALADTAVAECPAGSKTGRTVGAFDSDRAEQRNHPPPAADDRQMRPRQPRVVNVPGLAVVGFLAGLLAAIIFMVFCSPSSPTDPTASDKPAPNGYLTLSCNPRCDWVVVNGRSFVPPIMREPFPPGLLSVTATLGSMTKVIGVDIVAGQSTDSRIEMEPTSSESLDGSSRPKLYGPLYDPPLPPPKFNGCLDNSDCKGGTLCVHGWCN